MSTTKEKLDQIAHAYHLNSEQPDIHIENTAQVHVANWIEGQIQKNSSVLEMGYGDGILSEKLSNITNKLTILEGASALVLKAKKRLPPAVQVTEVLFEDYNPDPASVFDTIICSHVLEHVQNPVQLLKQMKLWLKPQGRIIIIVPNSHSLHRQLAVHMGLQAHFNTLSARDHLVGHLRVYSTAELENDIISAGFKVQQKKGFFIKILPNSMMLNFSNELLKALNELDHLLPMQLLANIGMTITKEKE